MVITYHGNQFFKIVQGDTTIAINPPESTTRFGATIGITSLNDPDFNGMENLSYGDRRPLLIVGPGEYEVRGISIQGFGIPITYKKEQKINTVYYADIEKIYICFLGVLQKPSLPEEIEERIVGVDVLFVPIGGSSSRLGDTLSPSDAHKIANVLEAKIVIPMHYEKDASPQLKKFLEEAGEKVVPIDKLTIRKKDFEGKEGEVVVLKHT